MYNKVKSYQNSKTTALRHAKTCNEPERTEAHSAKLELVERTWQ